MPDAVETSLGGTGYSRVGVAIRKRIIDGRYPPGSRLKIQELCKHFGISSNPVREALQQLQGEGLVIIHPNRGAEVRSIDAAMISHMYDIGAAIDGILARRCASMATAEQIATLWEIQLRMEQLDEAGDIVGRGALNGAFHSELGIVAGNTEAFEIRRRHHVLIGVIRLIYGHSAGRFEAVRLEHRAIIEAIERGDENAADSAARLHCLKSCEDALQRFHLQEHTDLQRSSDAAPAP